MECQIEIAAPVDRVWKLVSDIENCKDRLSAVTAIEVLEKPTSGLVGFKWKETRKLFGKEATEIMWITEAQAPEFYKVRAESHGSIYLSTISVSPLKEGSVLSFAFDGKAQKLGAKIMAGLMGWMFKGAMRKALIKDLEDLKGLAEDSSLEL